MLPLLVLFEKSSPFRSRSSQTPLSSDVWTGGLRFNRIITIDSTITIICLPVRPKISILDIPDVVSNTVGCSSIEIARPVSIVILT